MAPSSGCHPLLRLASIFWILSLTSVTSDIEENPGPRKPKYPCGTCGKAVTWKQKGIRCDNSVCQQWYHIDCQNMRSTMYEHMNSSNCSWECLTCAFPNFSTTLFDLHSTCSSNSFTCLSEDDSQTDHLSPGPPLASSSPTISRSEKPNRHTCRRPLRILNINCQSLINKKEEFDALLDSTHCDIIFGTESWLHNDIRDNEVFPPGYVFYRKDRNQGRGGGVFIGISDNIISSRVQDFETNCEILWVKIDTATSKSLYVAAYYKPSASDLPSLEDNLAESLARLPQGNDIWFAGDMNLPGIDWKTLNIKPSCPTPGQHNQFIDILADNGLTQIVEIPTRCDNVLDLIAVNNPTLVSRIEVLPGIADHDAVFAEIDINPKRYNQKRRKIPLYKKANWNKIKEDMEKTYLKIQKETEVASTDHLWNIFKGDLLQAVTQHIPHKLTSKRDRPPWIGGNIRRMMNTRNRLHKKIKTAKDIIKKEEMMTKMKDLKHTIRKETRAAYWSYIESIIVPNEDRPYNKESEKLFSSIKHRKSDSIGIAPLKDRGELKDNPRDKAEILNNQFKSVFTTDRPLEEDIHNIRPTFPKIDDIEITTKGIQKLLEQLQPHKAMGPDQLHPRVMKELAPHLAPALQTIFSKSLATGEIPSDWRKAHVTPIFKKGERYLASNYRPVSLTCISSKIMEHIIAKHIVNHLEKHKILTDFQHGFRSRRSTDTQLLCFAQDIYASLRKNQQTDVIVMDFAKAFDKVAHNRLILKFHKMGITGPINNWVKDFLTGREQSVVCEGEMSTWGPVTSGVPQGSVIGPILFLLYINDLPEGLKSHTRLFADDTIIYMTITSTEDGKTLQKDLDLLTAWEDRWQMEFHPQKCNVIRISKKPKPISIKYHLRGHVLDEVDSAKYLGVTIQKSFSWNEHITGICKKANGTLGFLKRNLQIHHQHIKANAYKTLVRPQLEYAAAVWDPYTATYQQQIENVQRRAARYVMNNYRQDASVDNMISNLQWRSLEQRRADIRLITLFKIIRKIIVVDFHHQLTRPMRPSRHQHPESLQVPVETKQYIQQSFLPRTITQWNNLTASVATTPSLDGFKSAVRALTH